MPQYQVKLTKSCTTATNRNYTERNLELMTIANQSIDQFNAVIQEESQFLDAVRDEIGRVIVGQEDLVERVLIALLGDGHILLEGVPGLAKTLLVRTVSDTVQADFSRLQFTPDMLPADIVGTEIYNPSTHEFYKRKGPIFANLVLADEINRAPAKVQSALLEAMQERQVTIGDETYPLDKPFLVLATQNPIEQEGTYPLPEAQVDRFMLKVKEKIMLDRMTGQNFPTASAVTNVRAIVRARELVKQIYVDDRIKEYILDLVGTTRDPKAYGLDEISQFVEFGASPRASLYLIQASRAHAFLNGRGYVTPEDIKAIAPDVLRHRIMTTYEAEAENITSDDIIKTMLAGINVP